MVQDKPLYGLGKDNALDNIGSNACYTSAQWIRNNSSYIVSHTEVTTYGMGIWTDYKASSAVTIKKNKMTAVKIK